MNFEAIRAFTVRSDLVRSTEEQLRKAGSSGYELFVLWTGVVQDDIFVARTMHVPQQTSYKMQTGLCVRVDGTALHGLNRWLFEHGEVLAIQIHTHPTEAYHSETDDSYPIVTATGGLSIVIPDFCRNGFFSSGTVAYRLRAGGWWQLPQATLRRTLQVAP